MRTTNPARETTPGFFALPPTVIAAAAFLPSAVVLAIILAVVVVTVVFTGSELGVVPSVVAMTWLGIHQIPLTVEGTTVGLLPAVPTVVMLVVIARRVRAALPADRAATGRELGGVAVALIGGPVLLTSVALAVVQDAAAVYPVASPPAPVALLLTAVLHALALVFGLGRGGRAHVLALVGAPGWAEVALRGAARFVLGLAAAGAVLLTGLLLVRFSAATELFEGTGGVGGALGFFAVSVLYLPDLVVAAAVVTAGGEVVIGHGTLSLFEVVGTTLPRLPAAVVFSFTEAAPWWPVLLVIPALLAVLVARWTLGVSPELRYAPPAMTAAALLAGAGAAGAAAVVGGRLGVYGWTGATPWLAGLVVGAWLLLVGLGAVLVLGGPAVRGAAKDGAASGRGRRGRREADAAETTTTAAETAGEAGAGAGPDMDAADVDGAQTGAADAATSEGPADADRLPDAEDFAPADDDAATAGDDAPGSGAAAGPPSR